ncbi:CCR4 [Symbiodinium natans]|uniref:CCR4 protein n=1 Tax=Symbiodinium natans TaxID=878477 RepID=A0A812QRM8_9DINO|nr:CCR4 [Symbiodinium natans]
MHGPFDALRDVLARFDPKKSNLIPTSHLRNVLTKILPDLESDWEVLLQEFAVGTFTDYQAFLASLQSAVPGDPGESEVLRSELKETRGQLEALQRVLQRHPLEFTVGQYNILAGYMGSNTEPWFLYGVDIDEDRRREIFRLHGERHADGRPANPGWPNYVRGVLSAEEIAAVEAVHERCFAWEVRKDRLLEQIRAMDCDVLSLVECDHYNDHFRPALAAMGYDSTWRKRPRPSSDDGCCVAWRRSLFELVKETSVEFVDKLCPVRQKLVKDRIAVVALLETKLTKQKICLVSTHLQRNPEDPTQDMLRARQVGQVLRALADFVNSFPASSGAREAPVVLTGDLNCTSFGRLRGIANTISLLNQEVQLHPFTFDCADAPTGVTSVTMARCMRIDAILYQSQRLELVDVQEIPDVSPEQPIPNDEQPSDHVPIVAQFRCRSRLHTMKQLAREWFLSLAGKEAQVPLNQRQLENAFKLYDYDGTGTVSYSNMRKVLTQLFGLLPDASEKALERIPNELTYADFVAAYLDAVKEAGLPGLEDLREAFQLFDRDQSGAIDQQELLTAFEQCAPATVPTDKLIDLFKAIDANGDQTIDLEEMLHFLAKTWADSFRLAK